MKSLKDYLKIEELPPKLSVFPLPGALLLPRTQLPLNIFEPRYLEMVDDALSNNRLIAMIQTQSEKKDQLFKVGCVGKIVSYTELTNNRMLVTLSGVCRFFVKQELEVVTPYRQFQVSYKEFSNDLLKGFDEENVNREKLQICLKKYLDYNNLDVDWESIKNSPTELLVNSLCLLSPYRPEEKQALLEAKTLSERNEILIAMTEMSMSSEGGTEQIQ
ncbi:LON peptidase substrate-binding domain-containing protein [Hyphomicrobiales bacterium]|nr:LON peptidase substrate-binding domain-containing protein [Hyphomicrobiales bacterium]